jgi:hypothetical protein
MVLYNNALKSARLAGFNVSNSPNYPYQLLARNDVQEGIQYYRHVYDSPAFYTQEKIIHQWSAMADFDILTCCNDDYSLKNLSELTPEQRKSLGIALQGLEVTERNGKRFIKPKLARAEALEQLGKIKRLYADEKQQGQGLALNISIGQQVTTQGATEAHTESSVGHLSFRVGTPVAEDVDDEG